MKRLLATSLIAASSLFAANDAELIEYLKAQVRNPALTITVENRKSLNDFKGYDAVTAKITDGKQSQVITLFMRDGLIFPDIIDIKTGQSVKQTFEEKALKISLKTIYKNENQKYIISLGNDPKKETMVVFTDPECPYCRRELEGVEDRLKSKNIKLILTPVHGKSSLEKSFLIYEEMASAKDDASKIAIMRKYFAKDVKLEKKVSDADVKKMEDLRKKYLQSGLKGVPFMIPEKEIL